MKDGVCTKCGKREVRRSPEDGVAGPGGVLSVTNLRGVRMRSYCCTACGWVERWVEDPEDLARIAEKWERAR